MPDTYSAKQVATRIGTDAKTLRKFLRSPSSPYQAVGQGKRYEFPTADLKAIKKAFVAWQTKNRARVDKADTKKLVDDLLEHRERKSDMEIIDDALEEKDIEPTDNELDEIEDEELEIEDE
jgi:predicted site-specific integrase-resolvase